MEPDPRSPFAQLRTSIPGDRLLSDGGVGCTRNWVHWTRVTSQPPPLPVFRTAHKQAWKTRSPPQQVQHEVWLCPASKAAACGQRQPTLLVSRSQSPLPPVTWGSRVPASPQTPASPSLEGASPRQEPAEPRRVPSGK